MNRRDLLSVMLAAVVAGVSTPSMQRTGDALFAVANTPYASTPALQALEYVVGNTSIPADTLRARNLRSSTTPAFQAKPKQPPQKRCVPTITISTDTTAAGGDTVEQFWDDLSAKTGGGLRTEGGYAPPSHSNGKVDSVAVQVKVFEAAFKGGNPDQRNRALIDKALRMLNSHEGRHRDIFAENLGKGACAARGKSLRRGDHILDAFECKAAKANEMLDAKEGEATPVMEGQNIVDFKYTRVKRHYPCPQKTAVHSINYNLTAGALSQFGRDDGYYESSGKSFSSSEPLVSGDLAETLIDTDIPEGESVEEVSFLSSRSADQPVTERTVKAGSPPELEQGVAAELGAKAPGGVISRAELRAVFRQTAAEFVVDGIVRLTTNITRGGLTESASAQAGLQITLSTGGPAWVSVTNCGLFEKRHFVNETEFSDLGDQCRFRTSEVASTPDGLLLGMVMGPYAASFELRAEASVGHVKGLEPPSTQPDVDERFSIRIVPAGSQLGLGNDLALHSLHCDSREGSCSGSPWLVAQSQGRSVGRRSTPGEVGVQKARNLFSRVLGRRVVFHQFAGSMSTTNGGGWLSSARGSVARSRSRLRRL